MKFQYNICFGSTIKLLLDKYNRIISIQHLFRFDETVFFEIKTLYKFQYNICFGSTQSQFKLKLIKVISIQHLFRFDSFLFCFIWKRNNFNTTFVSVRQVLKVAQKNMIENFNTTFVSVRHYWGEWFCRTGAFQYNICFGSTAVTLFIFTILVYFNTTFVSVRHL